MTSDEIQGFFSTSQWLWVDYGIAGLLAVSALVGFLRGMLREILNLLTLYAAFWVCVQYNQELYAYLADKVSYSVIRTPLSYAILFFVTLILGGLINFIITQLIQKTGLKSANRLLGLILGLARGSLLVSILVFLAGFTALPDQTWWKHSKCIPPFKSLAVWLKDNIPPKLAVSNIYR
jgi:membrane protein required for colicin V production